MEYTKLVIAKLASMGGFLRIEEQVLHNINRNFISNAIRIRPRRGCLHGLSSYSPYHLRFMAYGHAKSQK